MPDSLDFFKYYPDKNLKDFVYYKSLLVNNPQLWGEATSTLNTALSFFGGTQKQKSLSSLQSMMLNERKKEQDFLTRAGIVLPEGNKNNWNDLVQSFNLIYSTKDIFNRNISLVQAIAQGKTKNGNIDVVSYYTSYIKEAIEDFFKTDQGMPIEDLVKNLTGEVFAQQIIKNAMIKMYDSGLPDVLLKEGQEEYKAYSELRDILKKMDNNNKIFNDIIKEIGISNFDKYLDKMRERIQNGIKGKLPKFSVSARGVAGNLLELIYIPLINSIREKDNRKAFRTGDTLQKADVVEVTNTTIDVDMETIEDLLVMRMDGNNGYIRQQSIERIKKLYEVFTSGDIVFMSDKNYNLNSKFFADNKGMSAQSSVNLQNLNSFFRYIGEEKVDDLIFVLANTGNSDQLLNQNAQTLEDYIATKIAYFLFDDVTISQELIPENVNAIHVFNLDNIYLPFSVFLEAAYNAMNNITDEDYHKYVDVRYTPAPFNYKEQIDGLEKMDWLQEREYREKKSTLNFHFFGDFMNFINEQVKSII